MIVLWFACAGPSPEVATRPASPEAGWIARHLVPLATTDPAAPLDDLVPLDPWLADRRIVAVGEATHGTAEFFAFKHRLFRYLAERHGFTVLAMELPYDVGVALDDWAQGGEGDVHALLHGSYWWVDSGEILALVEWMRAYNATSPAEPVHIVGFDLQRPGRSAEALERILADLDPVRLAEVAPVLAAVQAGTMVQADAEPAMAALATLRTALETRPEPTASRALDHLTIVDQSLDILRWCDSPEGGCGHVKRDVYMAANARRLLDPMGELLREDAADPHEVASILLEFDRGGFVAVAGGFGQVGPARAVSHLGNREVAVYRVGPAPRETLASVFASVGQPLWFLDLALTTDPEISGFFATHRTIQEYGADPPGEPRGVSDQVSVPEGWDAVVFVAEIEPYTFID